MRIDVKKHCPKVLLKLVKGSILDLDTWDIPKLSWKSKGRGVSPKWLRYYIILLSKLFNSKSSQSSSLWMPRIAPNDNRNVSLYSFTRIDKWVREAIEFWAIPPLDLDSIFTYDNFQQCYLGQSPKIRKFQSKWQYHREYRGNKSRFLAHKVDKKDRGENQKMENCSMFTSCQS